jgi:hypothetical protein
VEAALLRRAPVDIGTWLRSLGLERYESAFRDNDVDAEVLPELTAKDLISIGVTSVGHRRKLLAAIAALSNESPSAQPLPEPWRSMAPDPLPPDLVRHIELQASRDLGLSPPPGIRHDLPHLIAIARLVANGGRDRAAAETIAEQIGGNPRVRANNKKQLYERFRKGRTIYLRIAQSPDVEAGIMEILHEAVRQRVEVESTYAMLRDFAASQRSD